MKQLFTLLAITLAVSFGIQNAEAQVKTLVNQSRIDTGTVYLGSVVFEHALDSVEIMLETTGALNGYLVLQAVTDAGNRMDTLVGDTLSLGIVTKTVASRAQFAWWNAIKSATFWAVKPYILQVKLVTYRTGSALAAALKRLTIRIREYRRNYVMR